MTSNDRTDPLDFETGEPDADADALLACHQCGAPLGDDIDDDASGGSHGQPICGECDRNRNLEADLAALDARDGSLDGAIDW